MPVFLPDFAEAIREVADMSRKQRRATIHLICLIPIVPGVVAISLALLR